MDHYEKDEERIIHYNPTMTILFCPENISGELKSDSVTCHYEQCFNINQMRTDQVIFFKRI